MKSNADMPNTVAEVFAPGEFIREEIEARGWTQEEFAEILGRPLQTVNQIINGKKEITPETAIDLANAFDTSPELWLNLESAYRLSKAKRAAGNVEQVVSLRAKLRAMVPVHELMARGWIRKTDDLRVLVNEICGFLEIKSLDDTPELAHCVATRKSAASTESGLTPGQLAWVYRAKHEARKAKVGKFDRKRFDEAIKSLGQLSVDESTGIRQAIQELAKLGVRIVFVPHLPQTRIDGAAFWLDANSPVIALSLRYDRIDSFWFTLMHELAHLFRGDCKTGTPPILDNDLVGEGAKRSEDKSDQEKEADRLASEWLIPKDRLENFIKHTRPFYSAGRIETFADEVKVHPGVVVGRLQFQGEIPWQNLRRMLVKASDSLVESSAIHSDRQEKEASIHDK